MLLNANPKKGFIIILLIAIIVLILPFILRQTFVSGALIGPESYENFRYGKLVESDGLVGWDKLSFGGRETRYEYGLPLLLAVKPNIMIWLIPIIFGLISISLFYFILKKYDSDAAFISSLFLIFSPAFIYLFTACLKYSGAVMFTLLGIYLFLKGARFKLHSYTAFLFVAFFSLQFSLFLIIAALALMILKKINIKEFLFLFFGIFLILLAEFRGWLFDFWRFFIINSDFLNGLTNIFFEISSVAGIGLFIFILGLAGIFNLWKEKYRYLLGYFLVFVSIILIIYAPFLLYIFVFVFSALAGYGFINLFDHEWKNDTIKAMTLIVILCGVLFSVLSFLNFAVDIQPSETIVGGIDFLAGKGPHYTVFADISRGDYILAAGKRTVIDPNIYNAPDLQQRENDMKELLSTSNINAARSIIYKYDIRYIWLDRALKDRYYLNEEDRFLYLLKYSPYDFIKAYDNKNVEIWEVMFRF